MSKYSMLYLHNFLGVAIIVVDFNIPLAIIFS